MNVAPYHVRVPGSTSNLGAGFDCVVDALGSFVLFAKGREDLVAGCIRAEEAVA